MDKFNHVKMISKINDKVIMLEITDNYCVVDNKGNYVNFIVITDSKNTNNYSNAYTLRYINQNKFIIENKFKREYINFKNLIKAINDYLIQDTEKDLSTWILSDAPYYLIHRHHTPKQNKGEIIDVTSSKE